MEKFICDLTKLLKKHKTRLDKEIKDGDKGIKKLYLSLTPKEREELPEKMRQAINNIKNKNESRIKKRI